MTWRSGQTTIILGAALFAGCANASPPGRTAPPFETSFEWAGLRFSARTLPAPADRLRIRAAIENPGGGSRRAYVPLCFPWIRAYRDGKMVWSQWERRRCAGVETLVELPGGAEERRWVTLPAEEILGDSLPPGEYRLALYVPRANRPGEPPRAPMELHLGSVRLEPAPAP